MIAFLIVSRPVLCNSLFLSRSVSTVFWSNLEFQLFAFCVTLFSFVCVMLCSACVTLLSVDYVTIIFVNVTRSGFSFGIQKCFYCRSTSGGADNGACVQCCAGKCAVSFHVTCIVLAGFALEPSDWPQPTETYCERHQRTRVKVSWLLMSNL